MKPVKAAVSLQLRSHQHSWQPQLRPSLDSTLVGCGSARTNALMICDPSHPAILQHLPEESPMGTPNLSIISELTLMILLTGAARESFQPA